MERLTGGTWSKRAFEAGMNEVWKPTLNDTNKRRITVWITDGEVSEGQEPCEILEDYIDACNFVFEIISHLCQFYAIYPFLKLPEKCIQLRISGWKRVRNLEFEAFLFGVENILVKSR